MATEKTEEGVEHLAAHRQAILVRSGLIGAASALPLPGASELLARALSRGLVYHVARLRYVDIDDEAAAALLDPPDKKQRLGILSALGGLLTLLVRRGRMRRLFAGLAVLHGLEEGSRAFHMATLLDHYCARHHTGAAIPVAEARRLRQTIDEASRAAQRQLTSEMLEQLATQGLRFFQVVPAWMWSQLRRSPDAIPPLPALAALAQEARTSLSALSGHRYLTSMVESFDLKWSEGPHSPQ